MLLKRQHFPIPLTSLNYYVLQPSQFEQYVATSWHLVAMQTIDWETMAGPEPPYLLKIMYCDR